MAIQIYCVTCRSSCSLDLKKCPKCQTVFGRDNRKYRVSVSVKGRRVNRIVDNLTIARKVEATIKRDMVRSEFNIEKPNPIPTLNDVWQKYLPWAKEHIKSWMTDDFFYRKHLEPRFGKKRLDSIAPLDIERLKIGMGKTVTPQGKPYSKATIKHQLILLRKLYNIARRWGLYDGKSPLEHVEIPKLNNQNQHRADAQS